jgi:hypothetical protein
MTEAEWLSCADPQPMLTFLRGRASDRKLRLFAVACCRQIWDLITADPCRRAVEAAEKYAEGEITAAELEAAESESAAAAGAAAERLWVVHMCVIQQATSTELPYGNAACRTAYFAADLGCEVVRFDEARAHQSKLLREIFGNPFRPATLAPPPLSAPVVALAQAIYADRAFARMPELGDALAAAGCTDAAVLAHCRGPGVHVRGCWVVDLILGKG